MSDTSHQQDDWQAFSQRLRLELWKRLADVGAMNPEEVEHFADAARSALWLELNAATFDKYVDLELAKVTA